MKYDFSELNTDNFLVEELITSCSPTPDNITSLLGIMDYLSSLAIDQVFHELEPDVTVLLLKQLQMLLVVRNQDYHREKKHRKHMEKKIKDHVEKRQSGEVVEKDKEYVKTLFKQFDEDGSGWISKAELDSAMKKLGNKLTKAQLDELFRSADENRDNKINFEEFHKLVNDCDSEDDKALDEETEQMKKELQESEAQKLKLEINMLNKEIVELQKSKDELEVVTAQLMEEQQISDLKSDEIESLQEEIQLYEEKVNTLMKKNEESKANLKSFQEEHQQFMVQTELQMTNLSESSKIINIEKETISTQTEETQNVDSSSSEFKEKLEEYQNLLKEKDLLLQQNQEHELNQLAKLKEYEEKLDEKDHLIAKMQGEVVNSEEFSELKEKIRKHEENMIEKDDLLAKLTLKCADLSELKEKIELMNDYDDLKEKIELMSDYNELKEKIELMNDYDELKEKIELMNDDDDFKEKIKGYETKLTEQDSLIATLKQEIDSMQKLPETEEQQKIVDEEEINQLRQLREKQQETLKENEELIARIEELKKYENDYDELKQRFENSMEEKDDLIADLQRESEHDQKVAELKEKMRKHEENMIEKDDLIAKLTLECADLSELKEKIALMSDYDELKEKIKELETKENDDLVSSPRHEIDEKDNLSSPREDIESLELEETIDQYKASLDKKDEVIVQLKQRIEKIQESVNLKEKEYDKLQEKLLEYEFSVKENDSLIADLKRELKDGQESSQGNVQLIEDLRNEISQLKQKVEEQQASLDEKFHSLESRTDDLEPEDDIEDFANINSNSPRESEQVLWDEEKKNLENQLKEHLETISSLTLKIEELSSENANSHQALEIAREKQRSFEETISDQKVAMGQFLSNQEQFENQNQELVKKLKKLQPTNDFRMELQKMSNLLTILRTDIDSMDIEELQDWFIHQKDWIISEITNFIQPISAGNAKTIENLDWKVKSKQLLLDYREKMEEEFKERLIEAEYSWQLKNDKKLEGKNVKSDQSDQALQDMERELLELKQQLKDYHAAIKDKDLEITKQKEDIEKLHATTKISKKDSSPSEDLTLEDLNTNSQSEAKESLELQLQKSKHKEKTLLNQINQLANEITDMKFLHESEIKEIDQSYSSSFENIHKKYNLLKRSYTQLLTEHESIRKAIDDKKVKTNSKLITSEYTITKLENTIATLSYQLQSYREKFKTYRSKYHQIKRKPGKLGNNSIQLNHSSWHNSFNFEKSLRQPDSLKQTDDLSLVSISSRPQFLNGSKRILSPSSNSRRSKSTLFRSASTMEESRRDKIPAMRKRPRSALSKKRRSELVSGQSMTYVLI